jgi:DNA-binding response OmpR family regulator
MPNISLEENNVDYALLANVPLHEARILVIDDELIIRDILSDILLQFNYIVTTAASGFEGIKLFRSGSFDLVFTDLGMPDTLGWEVALKVKEIDPKTVVVMLTGWDVELNEMELKKKKVDFVIGKPFRINQIYDVASKGFEMRKRMLET